MEEGRERGGKRAQGRAVVYKLGLFFFFKKKSKTTIRTAVSAVFKHVRARARFYVHVNVRTLHILYVHVNAGAAQVGSQPAPRSARRWW